MHFGFAEGTYRADPHDGLTLEDTMITNAVRCVPPQNKPLPAEIRTCNAFLRARIDRCRSSAPSWRWAASRMTACSRRWACGSRPIPSAMARSMRSARLRLFDSYHCSRYNTNTGVLTPEMFRAVFAQVRGFLACATAS